MPGSVSASLQQAQEHIQMWKTTLGGKGAQTKAAKSAAKDINSIFEKAKANYIEQAKTQSTNLHNQTKQTIEGKVSDATTLNEQNQEQIRQFLENNNAIAKYEQQIQEKMREREQIEGEIENLQGEVENDSLDQAKTGGSFKEVTVYTDESGGAQGAGGGGSADGAGNADGAEGPGGKKKPATATKKTVMVPTNNDNGNSGAAGRIKELNAQRSKLGDEIIAIRDNDEAKYIESNIEVQAKFVENMSGIKTDEAAITQAKTSEESQSTQIQTQMETGIKAEGQKLELKGQQEANKQLTNDAAGTKAATLKLALEAEEAAAQTAKSAPGAGAIAQVADKDAQARKKAIQELGKMDTDLSLNKGGAAKLNNENSTLATTNKGNLESAMNELKNGQFKSYTEELNNIYNDAMQKTSQYLQFKLADGTSADNATVNADLSAGGNDGGGISGLTGGGNKGNSQFSNILGNQMGNMLGNVLGNAVGGQGGDILNKVITGATSSLFG